MMQEQQAALTEKLFEAFSKQLRPIPAVARHLNEGAGAAIQAQQKAAEAAEAWSAVQEEVVDDIEEALSDLDGELSRVESEEDPLTRMQGLIRCRDKKDVLSVVMQQTKAEAASHLEGGAEEAAIQMTAVSGKLESVRSRADSMIADELRVLRGALESMEALLHENMAKLN